MALSATSSAQSRVHGFSAQSPFTVDELRRDVNTFLNKRYTEEYKAVFVRGEVSGWKVYSKGLIFFNIKDEKSQISCCFLPVYQQRYSEEVLATFKDGAVVDLAGSITLSSKGSFNFMVMGIRLADQLGEMMRRYLELKEKLQKEGLFDPRRKRPLPYLPRRIGVVTSETGAVIHDICRTIRRRFSDVHIRLYPSKVQGADAATELRAGLAYFNQSADWKADLLIIGRGGGSFEDLFCFNDEELVRAIANSRIPVIAAVGHESDVSLSELAADRRAGTPTMAAEFAVREETEIKDHLDRVATRLKTALDQSFRASSQTLQSMSQRFAPSLQRWFLVAQQNLELKSHHLVPSLRTALTAAVSNLKNAFDALFPPLKLQLQSSSQHLDSTTKEFVPIFKRRLLQEADKLSAQMKELHDSMSLQLERKAAHLDKLSAKLQAFSPYAVLDRGYSLTTDEEGNVVMDASTQVIGSKLVTRLSSGVLYSTVTAIDSKESQK